MAKQQMEGARAVVTDPLAPNPREQSQDRSLQVMGVRGPTTPSMSSLNPDNGLDAALQGVQGVLAAEFEKKKDEWITEGKIAFQTGMTEADLLAKGNKFTEQGYRTLQARDTVNKWYTEQTIGLDTDGKMVDPQTYAQKLSEQRQSMIDQMQDPTARKVASAAFEDMSPRLAQAQAVKHNEFNRQQRITAATDMLSSTARVSATKSVQAPGEHLPLSPTPVYAPVTVTPKDRDIGIRTILGEAANQGADGQAAVAHVLFNRTRDGRWSDTVGGVAMEPKQFSAWNAGPGGNNLVRSMGPGHPLYERAGQVFDAVASGRHVDPTGGATHYYSPAGMTKLVQDGSQTNVLPTWLDAERKASGGEVKIGGHVFVGRSAGTRLDPNETPTAMSLAAGTEGDMNAPGIAEGVANKSAVTGRGTEVMQWIEGDKTMSHADKATVLSDAMRRDMEAGDDTLFRDAGGIATLQRLGAKPGEVDEVLKSRARFEHKKQNGFNLDTEKFRDDILRRAESGEARDTILSDVDKRFKAGLLDDGNARALAHAAADKVRQQVEKDGRKSQLGNPDLLNELGGLYQYVATGGDAKGAAEAATLIAQKYGATDEDVKSVVGKMFNDSWQYQAKLRAETEKAVAAAAVQEEQKKSVERALSHGTGLADLSGTNIKTHDMTGKAVELSPKDYGILQVKKRWQEKYQAEVQAGRMTEAKATEEVARMSALELQKHNVVDDETVGQIKTGLAGNIMDGKTGKVDKRASDAYNFWLTMKRTPGISEGYMARVVPDEYTRTLLEQAFQFDSGTLAGEQALIKAHERLSDPNRDPNDKLKRDAVWTSTMEKGVKDKLLARTDSGFLARMFGTPDRSEQERILSQNRVAENYVIKRAELSYNMHPQADPEVHLTKALQDLQANADTVAGNLIIASPGKELRTQMGLKDFGPEGVDEAVKSYLRKKGEALWPVQYGQQSSWEVTKAAKSVGAVGRALANPVATAVRAWENNEPKGAAAKDPPLHITYNEQQGIITVDLYKDGTRKQTLGAPQVFFVKDIGAEYIKEKTAPTEWAKAWDTMFSAPVRAVKGTLPNVPDNGGRGY